MPNIKHILCPIDFSEVSAHAIEQAVPVAGPYKARISALHVCPPIMLPVPAVSLPEDPTKEDGIVTLVMLLAA
jgi:nucleotide-binding universal stress UspA family protein